MRSGERDQLVILALVRLADDPARAVELDRVDELDVRRPPPGGHQAVGLGAAVLVREDHGVADPPAALRRVLLVPGHERDVAETLEGARPGEQPRGVRERSVARIVPTDGAEGDGLDGNRTRAPGAQPRLERQPQPVFARVERAERQGVVGGGGATDEDDVLRIAAVHVEDEHGGLAPRGAPRARRARGADRGDDLGRCAERERLLPEHGRRGEEQQKR